MKKLVIFDFDGTLVDTITDVAICFNNALSKHGFPQLNISAVKSAVGGNLEQVVSRLLPEADRTKDNIELVKASYREFYVNSDKPNTYPYPGIFDLLDCLEANNVCMAINTNKSQALTNSLVHNIFPNYSFTSIIGYDERYPSKPDPYGVMTILKQCNVSVDDAIYIGDGKSDIDTASAANMDFLLVTWGQGTNEDMNSVPVNRIISKPDDILQFVMKERI